jgi:hypothetical protein
MHDRCDTKSPKDPAEKHLTKEGVVTQKSEQVKIVGGNDDTEQSQGNE